MPRGSKGNVKYWSKYSSRRKDSKYEDELRVSGIFFPSTRIEASDSCYLQKPLGDSDISLVVIIDLLLLAIMVENQNLQPHCKL